MSEEMNLKSKQNKLPIMEESGLTDAERRQLRTSQRRLFKQIITSSAKVDALEVDANAAVFHQIRECNCDQFLKRCAIHEKQSWMEKISMRLLRERVDRRMGWQARRCRGMMYGNSPTSSSQRLPGIAISIGRCSAG